MNHTPGPWTVFEHSWSDCSITAPTFDHGICSLDINHATEETQESDGRLMLANARLIAAAPAMLEALFAADLAFAEHGILASHATRIQIHAAIKAAKGEA